jgi:hypothetical protein
VIGAQAVCDDQRQQRVLQGRPQRGVMASGGLPQPPAGVLVQFDAGAVTAVTVGAGAGVGAPPFDV